MKINLLKVSAIALFMGLSQGAVANTVTIGAGVVNGSKSTFSTTAMHDSFSSINNFDDKWTFDVAKNAVFSETFGYATAKISSFMGVLKDGVSTVATFQLLTSPTSPVTKFGLNNFNLVAGHHYTVELTGHALKNATYASNSTFVSAVPEAEEWAMMVVGLGLIGVQLSRKGARNGSMKI